MLNGGKALNIHRLMPEAANELVNLHREVFPAHLLRYSIFASRRIQNFIRDDICKAGSRYFGVFAGELLLAYAQVRRVDRGSHLNYIATRQSAQCGGIGSALLERVLADAKEASSARMTLDVEAGNVRLVDWYTDHGFTQCADPKSKIVIDTAAVLGAPPAYSVCMSLYQRRVYREYGLGDIDVRIEDRIESVGLLGKYLFRIADVNQIDLLMALRDYRGGRSVIAWLPPDGKFDSEFELVSTTIRMEKRL